MMVKDEWLTAAMADDTVVVELLVRLKQSQAASPFPLRWGIRQPRSRTAMASRCDAVFPRNKDVDSTRCSPTTPLSWSGGASPSATADGFEESSRSASLSYAAGFKGRAANEYSAAASAAKRLRRKKTFAELKEEEGMLLKEKLFLKKELDTLRATFEEQRAENESLKKMKMGFNLSAAQCDGSEETSLSSSSSTQRQLKQGCIIEPIQPTLAITGGSDSSVVEKSDSISESVFFLPDLNMIPSED